MAPFNSVKIIARNSCVQLVPNIWFVDKSCSQCTDLISYICYSLLLQCMKNQAMKPLQRLCGQVWASEVLWCIGLGSACSPELIIKFVCLLPVCWSHFGRLESAPVDFFIPQNKHKSPASQLLNLFLVLYWFKGERKCPNDKLLVLEGLQYT